MCHFCTRAGHCAQGSQNTGIWSKAGNMPPKVSFPGPVRGRNRSGVAILASQGYEPPFWSKWALLAILEFGTHVHSPGPGISRPSTRPRGARRRDVQGTGSIPRGAKASKQGQNPSKWCSQCRHLRPFWVYSLCRLFRSCVQICQSSDFRRF